MANLQPEVLLAWRSTCLSFCARQTEERLAAPLEALPALSEVPILDSFSEHKNHREIMRNQPKFRPGAFSRYFLLFQINPPETLRDPYVPKPYQNHIKTTPKTIEQDIHIVIIIIPQTMSKS